MTRAVHGTGTPMKRELLSAVLLMGLYGYSISPGWTMVSNAAQAKTVAEIQNLGGKIAVDERNPGKPVCMVNLAGTKVTDAGVKDLREALPSCLIGR